MNKLFFQPLKFAVLGAALCAAVSQVQAQTSFSMQLVADNDFAVFSGTSSGINHLLYQNNFSWPDQISGLSTFTFNLEAGETTLYILALGGGGQENISGMVNGQDIAVTSTYDPILDANTIVLNPLNVQMSSDLGPYLTGWSADNGSVADGSFNASLADVQSAFGDLTWGSPDVNNSDNVIGAAAPNGYGFHFDDSTAHLFAIDASVLGIADVPEPSTWALFAVGVAFAGRKFYSRRGQRQIAA